MERIELGVVFQQVLQCVGLVELERVSALRVDVYPDHVESCPVVADAGAACAAEEVEESGAGHDAGRISRSHAATSASAAACPAS